MERVCHPPGSGSSVFSLSSFGWAANNSLTGVNDNGITRSYTYEDFNRLASSTRVSTPTNYSYDRFGNRYTAGSQSVSFDANNHVTSGNGVGYDAAGNTTSEIVGGTTNTYTYDAENRLISVNSGNIATYVYDALGRRAKRTVSGTGTEYLYDLSGRAISELASSGGGLIRTELYAGALHFATYVASSTFFAYSDWQGTERVRTDPSANVAEYCEWTPWGEFSSCTSGYSYTDPTVLSTHNYAGYERDSETGLDHMWYRYNDSRYGRFLTTDPVEGKQCNSQTLNLFVYVQDDPINFIDPKGQDRDDPTEKEPRFRDVVSPQYLPWYQGVLGNGWIINAATNPSFNPTAPLYPGVPIGIQYPTLNPALGIGTTGYSPLFGFRTCECLLSQPTSEPQPQVGDPGNDICEYSCCVGDRAFEAYISIKTLKDTCGIRSHFCPDKVWNSQAFVFGREFRIFRGCTKP